MVWSRPHENYVDRCSSAFFGLWRSTVSDQSLKAPGRVSQGALQM
ncbi:MAG: hypothetical protein IKJ89_01520 [Kiritimatiellae bacterium]|nr:hypothetical protein [Kiritimatiellia bacterium]